MVLETATGLELVRKSTTLASAEPGESLSASANRTDLDLSSPNGLDVGTSSSSGDSSLSFRRVKSGVDMARNLSEGLTTSPDFFRIMEVGRVGRWSAGDGASWEVDAELPGIWS